MNIYVAWCIQNAVEERTYVHMHLSASRRVVSIPWTPNPEPHFLLGWKPNELHCTCGKEKGHDFLGRLTMATSA